MRRVLVAAFSEVPSLSFESEAATEVAKAFEGWCPVDVVATMLEASAHLEAFHGGHLHRVAIGAAAEFHAAAAAFERALERQIDGTPYDAVHLLSPVGAKAIRSRIGDAVPFVVHLQPLPSLVARWPDDPSVPERLAEDEAAALDAAHVLILHDPADASAIRYRRRLPPHVLLAEPVDLDAYHWEQLVPAEGPVVLALDDGRNASAMEALATEVETLDRAAHVSLWTLSLATGRIRPGTLDEDLPLVEWASGKTDVPVRLRVAARTALNSADVVVLPHPARSEAGALTVSCRRWGILEAAACRRPLVVGDSPRFPIPGDLAEHVFRLASDDRQAMAQLLRSVLLHPAKALQVAERAALRVAATHHAAGFRRRLRAVYAGLLGHDPSRPGPMAARPPASSGSTPPPT